ncbi:FAD-dependent oxidoreductase [Sulfobacillus thermosulfidooxidans]|uniref:FAD-dependent oxidoreductase n=1 Tax=Sulfobacillus thermosulfidooxidans TaxID=28034 RepID=UPI00031D1161|nr:FAD-dependent oxidoreductase [Sulfobacillus thermosulfidooxidans]
MSSLVIIGGSDAGISAALRAKEYDPSVEVTMLVADAFPNYSICGLPFYLSGEVPDWHQLAHRTLGEIESSGIRVRLNTRALAIDPASHTVQVQTEGQSVETVPYDKLVIGTGSEPIRPSIFGVDQPGVFLLHNMEDSFHVAEYLDSHQPRRALIIGAGYIGLEMADALRHREMAVTLAEQAPTVLPTVDPAWGMRLRDHLTAHGIVVRTGVRIEGIARTENSLHVIGSPRFEEDTDLVLVVVGVQPVAGLAREAGLTLGIKGAIPVDRTMATALPDIYAAGDCVETYHRLLGAPTYLPLGTTAHKQGRVAGENAVGGEAYFAGSLGTQVVKVFDWAIARTGLRDDEALAAGFEPQTVEFTAWDHKAYYPGAHELTFRITGDRITGRLLGAQMLGHWQAAVAKRIDFFAMALYHQMTVAQCLEVDLSYTPPLGSPWDAVQMAADHWLQVVRSGHGG